MTTDDINDQERENRPTITIWELFEAETAVRVLDELIDGNHAIQATPDELATWKRKRDEARAFIRAHLRDEETADDDAR